MRTENYKVGEIVELRIPNEDTAKKGIIVDITFVGESDYLGDSDYAAIVYSNEVLAFFIYYLNFVIFIIIINIQNLIHRNIIFTN